MNSDEPALVPQWLQKGVPPGSTGGHNSSSTSQFSLRDSKTRPKREAPASTVRTNATASREGAFGRTERDPIRRERSNRDSWTASPLGSTSASTYRAAAPVSVRNTRPPPERQVSDNGRSNTELGRESFGAASSGRPGVFRTQSGPPLRDREDFGFGPSSSYHDNYRFQPLNGRGNLTRGAPEKPPFEQDFPTLAGRGSASKPWLSGNGPPAEQPWTRLADAPEGGTLSPRGPSPGPPPSPRLAMNQTSQGYPGPGHTGAGNGELEGLNRPSMSKLIGGEPRTAQSRMADTLHQGASQSIIHAPSHDKARLEELVIRQSKQLVPVVATASNRDKGKGKGPTATTPKLGAGSSAATLLGVRSKPGLDKRPEDATTGPVMTGLGPSLRRLPSVDARTAGTSTTASQPEGTSDAGDSADGNASGNSRQPVAKDLEKQRTSFFQSLRRSSKTPQPNPSPAATPTSPPSPSAQQPLQPTQPSSNHKELEDSSQTTANSTGPAVTATNSHSMPSTSDQSEGAPSTSASVNQSSSSAQLQQNGMQADKADPAELQQQARLAQQDASTAVQPSEVTNGHKSSQAWDANDPQMKVSAEEEAFLRSLGWTEPGDDEDGGLTEEEIAAFKANTQHLSIKSFRPSADSFSGLNANFLQPKTACFSQVSSQPADISSSDSESDF